MYSYCRNRGQHFKYGKCAWNKKTPTNELRAIFLLLFLERQGNFSLKRNPFETSWYQPAVLQNKGFFFLKTVKAMIQMTSIFSSVNSFSHEPVKAVFFLEEDVFQGKIFTDADVDDSLLRRTTPTFEVGLQMREIGAQRSLRCVWRITW